MTESNILNWSWLPRPINHNGKRPVFITGAPRCGSSWVGEILGDCEDVRYVYEPFNHEWMPALHGHLSHFSYLNDAASHLTRKVAERAFQGRQSLKQIGRAAYRGYLGAATRKATSVVVKDPTASLMSAWISTEFDAQILFVMRHPCGFASSLDTLGWQLGVHRLLRQDSLMQDYLEPYRDLLNQSRNDKWLTRGAIWACIHLVYFKQMETYPGWHLFRYEDICNDPSGQYVSMAQKLGLELGKQTRQKIKSLSAADSSDPGSTQRKSRAMPEIWRQRMSPDEIGAVMGMVSEFGIDCYSEIP